MIRTHFIHATYFLIVLAIWIPGWRYQANGSILEQFTPANLFFAKEIERETEHKIKQIQDVSNTYFPNRHHEIRQHSLFADSLCRQVDYSSMSSDEQRYLIYKDTLYQQLKPLLDEDSRSEAGLYDILGPESYCSLSGLPFSYPHLFGIQKAMANMLIQDYFYDMIAIVRIECWADSYEPRIFTNILFPSVNEHFVLYAYVSRPYHASMRSDILTGRINNQEYEGKYGAIRYQTTFRKPGKQPLAIELCLTNSKNGKMVLRDTVWVNVQK